MGLNTLALFELSLVLPARDIYRLEQAATHAAIIEADWVYKLEHLFHDIAVFIVNHELAHEETPKDLPMIDDFFVAHAFSTIASAFDHEDPDYLPAVLEQRTQMAAPPKGRIPRSAGALRILWDEYRKTGKMPPRQRELADRVKKAFLKKAQEVFRKHAEEFLAGHVYDKQTAIEAMMRRLAEPYARAKMTVETETTRYYNATRREIYDQSPDVTHYLFAPIRDYATTPWCRDRSGLVYKKGDPLLDRETPPIHWGCRSELLPLTPQNPQHRRMIEDKKRWRRSHSCTPLPPGWNKSA